MLIQFRFQLQEEPIFYLCNFYRLFVYHHHGLDMNSRSSLMHCLRQRSIELYVRWMSLFFMNFFESTIEQKWGYAHTLEKWTTRKYIGNTVYVHLVHTMGNDFFMVYFFVCVCECGFRNWSYTILLLFFFIYTFMINYCANKRIHAAVCCVRVYACYVSQWLQRQHIAEKLIR